MSLEDMAVKFRDVLHATERLPSAELRAYRRNLLIKLAQHAAAHVPFYAQRLAPVVSQGEVSLERWAELPLLTRAAIQDRTEELRARMLPPYCGAVHEGSTSGSTGRPIRYRHEDLHEVASAAQTDRMFGWWGLDGSKTLASFMSTYDESARAGTKKRWGWRIGVPDGIRHINELIVDIDTQIDWLKAVRANYLFARGGVHIAQLASRAKRRGERLRIPSRLSTGSAVDA